MPTYSYRCTECTNAFDIQQSFTDDSLTECPACLGRLRKVFSAIGVTFNGSGFYRNDSRAKTGGESKSSGSESKSSGSDGKKSDAKASTAPSSPAPSAASSSSSSKPVAASAS